MNPRGIIPLLLFFACLSPAVVLASERDPASAEVQFLEGVRLWKAARFDEACVAFRASQALDPSASALVKIGNCHEHEGRIADAWYSYVEAMKLNAESDRIKHRAGLEREIASYQTRLKKKLGHVIVKVTPADTPGLMVQVRGRPVPKAALGQRLVVDQGTVEVVAAAPGFLPARVVAEVASSEDQELVLAIQPDPSASARSSQLSTSASIRQGSITRSSQIKDADPEPDPWRVSGLLIGGSGLTSLGIAAGFGIATLAKVGASDEHCRNENLCDLTGLRLRDEARVYQTAGLVLLGVGTALTTTGALLYWVGPKDSPSVGVSPGFVTVGKAF